VRETDVDAVKVVGVHDSSLKELHLSEVSLEQTFQLKSRLLSDTTGQTYRQAGLSVTTCYNNNSLY